VRIGIFDIRGALVRTLTDEVFEAGTHSVVWNGEDDSEQAQPSGVYFAQLLSGGRQEAVKLTLVR
jgi:flagellar hook assembly protein FlgD